MSKLPSSGADAAEAAAAFCGGVAEVQRRRDRRRRCDCDVLCRRGAATTCMFYVDVVVLVGRRFLRQLELMCNHFNHPRHIAPHAFHPTAKNRRKSMISPQRLRTQRMPRT